MKTIKTYFVFLLTFLVIDAIWIVAFAGEFYQQQLTSGLLKTTPDYSLVGVFYLCYAAGAVYLCVCPAVNSGNALLSGAVFGALAYGTFSITNYTLIQGWLLTLVIVDVLWGAFLTAISCLASYRCYHRRTSHGSELEVSK